MTPQSIFDQKSREVAAAAPLLEGMPLEIVHHAAGQSDVDPLGAGGISHGSRAGSGFGGGQPLLQLLHEILENRHDSVKIFTQYSLEIVPNTKLAGGLASARILASFFRMPCTHCP